PLRAIAFGIGEGALIFSAVFLGYLLFGRGTAVDATSLLIARGILVTSVFQLCLYYFDLYEFSGKQNLYDMAIRITHAWGAGCVVIAFFYNVVPAIIISTKIFLLVFLLAYVGVLLWRGIYVMAIQHRLFTTRL